MIFISESDLTSRNLQLLFLNRVEAIVTLKIFLKVCTTKISGARLTRTMFTKAKFRVEEVQGRTQNKKNMILSSP